MSSRSLCRRNYSAVQLGRLEEPENRGILAPPETGRWRALPGGVRTKIYGGTPVNGDQSLCSTCRFATIIKGRSLDEEVVHCHSIAINGMRVPFKVTSCTSHSDIDQPTYMQLLEDAWILKPASKRKPAGFVKHSDLKIDERRAIMVELCERDDT